MFFFERLFITGREKTCKPTTKLQAALPSRFGRSIADRGAAEVLDVSKNKLRGSLSVEFDLLRDVAAHVLGGNAWEPCTQVRLLHGVLCTL